MSDTDILDSLNKLRHNLGIRFESNNHEDTYWSARGVFLTRILILLIPCLVYTPVNNFFLLKDSLGKTMNCIYVLLSVSSFIICIIGRNGDYPGLTHTAILIVMFRFSLRLLDIENSRKIIG